MWFNDEFLMYLNWSLYGLVVEGLDSRSRGQKKCGVGSNSSVHDGVDTEKRVWAERRKSDSNFF